MIFRTYVPKLTQVVFQGHRVQGFAKGSKVNVKMAEDDFEMVTGTDGDVTMLQHHNPTGMITFRTSAESPSNDFLSARAIVNRRLVPVVGPSLVKNLNSTSFFEATYTILKGLPESDHGDDAGVREWVILCADLQMYVGSALL